MNWLNDIIGVINNYLWVLRPHREADRHRPLVHGPHALRADPLHSRNVPPDDRGRGAKPREGHISTFQAFCVSTASRVGVGNIAGIAIAVATGGPGAVFWMWVIATIGAASASSSPRSPRSTRPRARAAASWAVPPTTSAT